MEPVMLGAYVLVGGVGLVCIGAAWMESKMWGGPFEYVATFVNGLLKIGLPASYFFLLLRFVMGL
ncbi:hypothetical protein SM193_09230 [Bacillus velezensis]|uniref:hypothetical protein n=1 Tax=Bacillus velezensis TaxID=492670 RepID=UPI0037463A47